MKISINRKKDLITFFFKNAIKIVVNCKNYTIEKFQNGIFCNRFYLDEDYPAEAIPSYVKQLSKYSYKQNQ